MKNKTSKANTKLIKNERRFLKATVLKLCKKY